MPIRIHDLAPLFEQVQQQPVFPDGKTFVDCQPKYSLQEILARFDQQRKEPGFSLTDFVNQHFDLPHVFGNGYHTDPSQPVEKHIEALWSVLTRQPTMEENSSLIPLPYPYVVPGGRFGEIYYWDSYFTMLGLVASGHKDKVRDMVQNFAYLIETIGYVPNGNRTYYLGRSQPPFFSLMVALLEDMGEQEAWQQFLPTMEMEYNYWMKGKDHLPLHKAALHQVVRMPGEEVLNRYYDESETPRPEAYREDMELHQKNHSPDLFRHLRAGAASGWDFSSRWFTDPFDFSTIHTTDFVPVDLNSLIYLLEMNISVAAERAGDEETAWKFNQLALRRKEAIRRYCWHPGESFFVDFDWTLSRASTAITLAGCFPLFAKIATEEEAALVADRLERDFLQEGGLVTSLHTTGQQWDAPNGWAPLQWVAVRGLENYGHTQLASTICQRWMDLNRQVFARSGKMMEKYNVVNTHLEAGGGEYPGQDGFGWTNGVFMAMGGE